MVAARTGETEVLISADSHVTEPAELWERLPAEMREMRPVMEALPDGGELYSIERSTIRLPLVEELGEDDWACEYRRDPSGARDLSRRMADMAREGVDAQVVFPEAGVSATDSDPTLSDVEDRSDLGGAA